jgi:hypothetical protein
MKKTLVALLAAVPLLAFGSGKAATLSNGVLNTFFRTTALSAPANTYVGLLSTCPTTGSVGTEISGNGYTRSSALSKADATWTYTAATFISASTIKNTASIAFPTATTNPWTVNCFGVWDASTAGNLLYWGPVTGAPVTISVGATASFAALSLTITEQ